MHHVAVLLDETIDNLGLSVGDTVIDATFGRGGHCVKILNSIGSSGIIIALDQDEEAIESALELQKKYPQLHPVHTNFINIKSALHNIDIPEPQKSAIKKVNGIVFDLGISSPQIDTENRGFSFKADGPLDMRMNRHSSTTAAELVNNLSADELKTVFSEFGEEHFSGRIANAIVAARRNKLIETTHVLANIIKYAVPVKEPQKRQDCITRVFQALRIAVNQELEALKKALRDSLDILKPGGKLAVISFHSLEDRIVKHFFLEQAKGCTCPPNFPKCTCGKLPTLKIITRKPTTPTEDEIRRNPRSRSARLRVAERL